MHLHLYPAPVELIAGDPVRLIAREPIRDRAILAIAPTVVVDQAGVYQIEATSLAGLLMEHPEMEENHLIILGWMSLIPITTEDANVAIDYENVGTVCMARVTALREIALGENLRRASRGVYLDPH